MELSEKRLGFRPRLALDALSHERCRGGGDGTALTLEADVLDHIALEIDMKREAVAAERVIAFGFPMRAFDLAVVPWLFAVVPDQLLIEFLEIGH